jgi:hypothetical protein
VIQRAAWGTDDDVNSGFEAEFLRAGGFTSAKDEHLQSGMPATESTNFPGDLTTEFASGA